MKKLIFSLLVISNFSWGNQNSANYQLELKDNRLTFKPSAGHHFNTQAPTKIWIEGEDKQLQKLSFQVSPNEVTSSLSSDAKGKLSAQLYLCDDLNTYCIPKKKSFLISDLKNKVESGSEEKISTDSTSSETKISKLFIVNDPTMALEKALKTKKPLLIDFYGAWCPPCNILDETVFNKTDFIKMKKDYVYLKLDADDPISFPLKSKYNIKGYPTVVITTSLGEEITRIVGSRTPQKFFHDMKMALKYKNFSIEERKSRAESGKYPTESWDLGLSYWNQENYELSYKYFLKASNTALSAIQKDFLLLNSHILMLSGKDPELQKQAIENLKISLDTFPELSTFYEKMSRLSRWAEESKDEPLVQWTNKKTIELSQKFLKLKKLPEDSELTRPDLWTMIANAQEGLKMMEESKISYKNAADEYLELIKKDKLDINASRGYNIERIYCIYKSGNFEKAHALYLEMEKTYPDEFTFYYNHGQVLKEMKKIDEALEKAQNSLKFSYGDNKLRATGLVAELYILKGEKQKAKQLLEEIISSNPPPSENNVRTHRYLAKLKKLKEENP